MSAPTDTNLSQLEEITDRIPEVDGALQFLAGGFTEDDLLLAQVEVFAFNFVVSSTLYNETVAERQQRANEVVSAIRAANTMLLATQEIVLAQEIRRIFRLPQTSTPTERIGELQALIAQGVKAIRRVNR